MKSKKRLAMLMALCFGAFSAFAQPGNDDCANADELTVGKTHCLAGTNVNATTESPAIDADSCYVGQEWFAAGGTNAPNANVWFHFTTGSAGGSYTISTDNGGTMDTQMKLLTGTCGSWTHVHCDDDGGICNALSSEITASLAGMTKYYVMIDGFDNEEGDFNISVVYNDETTDNDCINDAILVTNDVNSVTRENPFTCKLYCYENVQQELISTSSGFYSNCSNPLGEGDDDVSETYFGVWFTFEVDNNTKATWASCYPAETKACDDSEDIFYTMHLFKKGTLDTTETSNCTGSIVGLDPVGCAAGDGLGVNDTASVNDGYDKSACSFLDHPRLNISGLANGTYYVMVSQMTRFSVVSGVDTVVVYDPLNGTDTLDVIFVPTQENAVAPPLNGQFYLSFEAAPNGGTSIDGTSSDGFANAADFDSDTCLTNAGLQGNIWAGNGGTANPAPKSDEPLEYDGTNAIGGSDNNCTDTTTIGGSISLFNNNSALYAVTVDTTGIDTLVCYTKDELKELILEIYDAACPLLVFYPRRLPTLFDPQTGDPILSIGDTIADLLGDTIYIPSEHKCEFIRSILVHKLCFLLDILFYHHDTLCVYVNCTPNLLVTMKNITACGSNGAATVGQLVTVIDSTGRVYAWGIIDETTECLCLRVFNVPPGKYYVVVDGKGSVMKYDLSIEVEYRLGLGGAPCSRQPIPPSANKMLIDNDVVSDFSLAYLQPVPATNELQVGFSLVETSAEVRMRVFDMTGKEVLSVETMHAQSGLNRQTLDISDLNAGLYILSVEKGDERVQSRFMKVD